MKIPFNKSNNWLLRVIQANGYATSIQQQRFTRRYHSKAQGVALPAEKESTPAPAGAGGPLLDLHGRRHTYLRISLTERCNLRCQYCMPAEGVQLSPREALLSRAELARLVRVLAACGVTRLRLTGGEPTLRPDLAEIVQELSSIPGIESVGMTSNGVALTRRLPALHRAGLTRLNLSLDSLRPDRLETMARRPV